MNVMYNMNAMYNMNVCHLPCIIMRCSLHIGGKPPGG
jgi:hypothetical protein